MADCITAQDSFNAPMNISTVFKVQTQSPFESYQLALRRMTSLLGSGLLKEECIIGKVQSRRRFAGGAAPHPKQ